MRLHEPKFVAAIGKRDDRIRRVGKHVSNCRCPAAPRAWRRCRLRPLRMYDRFTVRARRAGWISSSCHCNPDFTRAPKQKRRSPHPAPKAPGTRCLPAQGWWQPIKQGPHPRDYPLRGCPPSAKFPPRESIPRQRVLAEAVHRVRFLVGQSGGDS